MGQQGQRREQIADIDRRGRRQERQNTQKKRQYTEKQEGGEDRERIDRQRELVARVVEPPERTQPVQRQ
jgi:hypothetical protein